MSNKQYKIWIDILKGVCMICVYLCHSEGYYDARENLGYIAKPFYVNAFFFVSGYLFFGKWLNVNMLNRGGYLLALKNMLYRLVIPTILFSTIIYVPKILFHNMGLTMADYFIDVFMGISYWFTSALAVAQLLLLIAIFVIKRKTILTYLLISLMFFVFGFTLNMMRTGNEARDFLPWFYKTGMEYTIVMAAGGVYQQYEHTIDKVIRRFWMLPFLTFIGLLLWAWIEGYKLKMIGLGGQINTIGLMTLVCGIVVVTTLSKRIKATAWLTWIGRNSIVFYFFSGVFPAMVSAVMLRLCPWKAYPVALAVTIIAITLGALTTYMVNRFAPFLVDIRKIHDQQ